ncbi:MAG: transglycosylase SLT domain-containing protein [Mangrovibacterium sp.]
MRNIPLLIVFVLGLAGQLSASPLGKGTLRQIKRIEVVALDTIHGYEAVYARPDENLNDLFSEQLDSLISSWYIRNSFPPASIPDTAAQDTTASLPDSVYIGRLQSIESYIDLSFNKTVRNFIELYTRKQRGLTELILGLSAYYFPIIEEQLDKYNLPMELKYLPIIESALNPNARSRANAVGLWQFMYGTGKMYKLEIGTFVDERRDPVKSTEAAVRYLHDLYKIYKDWHLVIAAYNCGPGNVNKAIRRSGGKRNYWSIYYRLPRETRGYVPAFIAAAYVMNHYHAHQLSPQYPDFPVVTDTIRIHDYLHFKQVSEVLDIPLEELKALNPQYRMNIIPGRADKPYPLRIPVEQTGNFIDYEKQIFAWNREKLFPNNEIRVPHGQTYHPAEINGKARISYTVKEGDNLGFISEWFHVRVSDLRYWNNIRRNLIRAGQKLVIYVPKAYSDFYLSVNDMSFSQKQQHARKRPVPDTQVTASTAMQPEYDGEFVYYTVKSGDTLWSIAKKFPGVSNTDIIKLNNMGNGNRIKPGQKLKIHSRNN